MKRTAAKTKIESGERRFILGFPWGEKEGRGDFMREVNTIDPYNQSRSGAFSEFGGDSSWG
jgi:hypothetical protein